MSEYYREGATILKDEVTMTMDEVVSELCELSTDAIRYRKLRVKNWSERGITVVKNSSSVKLGHECLSYARLDAALDAEE